MSINLTIDKYKLRCSLRIICILFFSIISNTHSEGLTFCGNNSSEFKVDNYQISQSLTTPRFLSPQSFTIDIVYDLSFKQKYGTTGAEKLIDNVINNANFVFSNNLGIKLNVLSINYLESFDKVTSVPEIYEQLLKLKRILRGSVLHLFTAKDFGNLHGAAYEIGSLCRESGKSFSFSVSNSRTNLTNVFMHEVAHNLGANHIISTPKTIMSPDLNYEVTSLVHSQTKGEIKLFLDNFGKCESLNRIETSGASTPDSLNLDVFKSTVGFLRPRVQFSSTVKLSTIPLPLSIELMYKRRKRKQFTRVIKRKNSDLLGRSKIRAKRKGFYQVRISDYADRTSQVFRFSHR